MDNKSSFYNKLILIFEIYLIKFIIFEELMEL